MKNTCNLFAKIANKFVNIAKHSSEERYTKYYSHYGEDAILNYIFKTQQKGFYVDVGCYHPDLFSNTKYLYKKGWRGINIDANSDTIALFDKARSNDINLNIAISDKESVGEYFKFLEIDSVGGGSGNSFSTEVKQKYEKQGLKAKSVKINMYPLANILSTHVPSNVAINFLNIDVEGFDLQVL